MDIANKENKNENTPKNMKKKVVLGFSGGSTQVSVLNTLLMKKVMKFIQ